MGDQEVTMEEAEGEAPESRLVARIKHDLVYRRSGQALLAVTAGTLTGLACVAFYYLIIGWEYLMTGFTDYAVQGGASHGWLGLGSWFVIFVPVISALIYAPIVQKWAPTTRGLGIPEVMLAVRRNGGKIPRNVWFIKVLAAALTIGGGGSVGKEGPVVQTGAAVSSLVGSRLNMPAKRVMILVSCGAAAGVSATFNAPLAAAVFAMEVILVKFSAEIFGMAVLASVSSAIVSRAILGDRFIISLPGSYALESQLDLWAVPIVGLICGLGGVLLSKTLYTMTDIFDRIDHGPEWRRPVVGGLILGVGLWIFPELYGTSSALQAQALTGEFTASVLLMYAGLKVLFTSYTIAMGGTGGVFAPSLFIGATTGTAIGILIDPFTASDPAVFGVIGMGASFAGAARAPMAAVLIIIEMTGQYSLVLPLMLAIVIATAASRFLTRKTIYTEKLVRRGDRLDDPVDATLMGRNEARVLMGPVPGTIEITNTVEEASQIMRASESTMLPVLDENGKFAGTISSLELASASLDGEEPKTVGDLHLETDSVSASVMPSEFMRRMLASRTAGLPVVENGVVIGWLSSEDLVRRMYREQRRAIERAESETSWGSRLQERRRHRDTPDGH
ncbi:MAG: chloride channel protein [Actinomycetaceae bacterium]|nr:chloride channel protein [Actinomycetaceae bacterium]